MKRFLKMLGVVVAVSALVIMGAMTGGPSKSGAADSKLRLSWGGSQPGGVMYYMVGVAANIFNKKLSNVILTQVTTGGSTENTKRMLKNELDFGISYGSHVYMSLHDQGPFKGFPKGSMIRGVARAYVGPHYFVTLKGSPIKKMSDLEGKTVAIGPPGSGTQFNSKNVLGALGINVKAQYLTFAAAGRAMANRRIDAFAQSSMPSGAVTKLSETHNIYVIPYSDEEIGKLEKKFPFYKGNKMPATTYKGVPETQMPFFAVYWVAHERVPADAVYNILKLAYEPGIRKQLEDGYKSWKGMAPDVKNFQDLGAPMHPGALKYYKEKGMMN